MHETMIDIRIVETADEVARQAARLAADVLKESLATRNLATFVLAGGRLPPVASKILSQEYAKAFDWSRILFLIGDERCVPLDDPQSSWLSLLSMFGDHPEIPDQNKLRPLSNLSTEEAANTYSQTLQGLAQQAGLPVIDHMWFGVGEDGHTLSLFPNHSSSDHKSNQLVIPVYDSPKPPPSRISFSYQALRGVRSAVVFVSGASKAPILARIAQGDRSLPIVIASQIIDKAGGHVTWLVDREAMEQTSDVQLLRLS